MSLLTLLSNFKCKAYTHDAKTKLILRELILIKFEQETILANSVSLHRVLRAPISRVFRAFSDPDAKASWISPFGYICKVHSFEFKVGGNYKMSFRNFTNDQSHSWSGNFTHIKTNELVIYKDRFDDPNLPGEMTVTVILKEVSSGTDLSIKQEGISDMIPTEMCYLGWQESLTKLAQLVEPEINS
jgi:uncharacterized protein YndB with AHSA1/START domain